MPNIYSVLEEIDIPYVKHEHPPVYTCEEADKYYKDIEGGRSKNLFLRNKKGNKHYLVVLESHKQVDLKALAAKLGESKMSFASEDRLMKYLGLTKGAVSPFGLINDEEKQVTVIVDNELLQFEKLHYHPNVNTATLEISKEMFLKFLKWCGNERKYIHM